MQIGPVRFEDVNEQSSLVTSRIWCCFLAHPVGRRMNDEQ